MTAVARRRRPPWLLVAAILWPTAAVAQEEWAFYPAHLSPCETTLVDAGRPEAHWALIDGVYEDERDRRGVDWVWTSRQWRVRLLLASTGERTLTLIGRRGPPGLELRAFWNGADLGARAVGRGRVPVSWTVPAERTRTGLNLLRFEASEAHQRERQLAFKLDRLELAPAGADCGPVETATTGAAFKLAPGAILLLQPPLPPRAEVTFELSGAQGNSIELLLSRDGRPQRQYELSTGAARSSERLEIGSPLSNEMVLVSRGPGVTTVRLLEIAGDDRSAAWRAPCGLWWKEPLAAAALLALLSAVVYAGRRWTGGRFAPWLDSGLLLALALALRFAFLDQYPEVDPKRFGDSWEYLRRSRYLLQGASFWSDVSWHAWVTWIRPPGYYLFLAATRDLLGGGLAAVAAIQAVLLAATTVAGYLIAYPLFGRGAALVAGLLLACYPQAITSATWILSDPLSLFLTTTALACLAWAATRRSWPLALAAGLLFGVACLVRSAPLYFVPLAAVLLYLGQGAPRRKAPALVLAGAALLVVMPWCVRNSLIYGKPMGIDDLVIPNFLMAHPDPEILPPELVESGVWGAADEQREKYFRALWRGNKAARLTLDGGRILRRGLLRMAANPGTTLRRFGLHLKIYFQLFPRFYPAHFLNERDGCRITLWTDSLNGVYLLTLLLALPGMVLALRQRQSWPLVAWILFFVLVTNLFFYPSYMPGRYRLPIYPALAAFAGLGFSRTVGLLVERLRRRRRPAA